MARLAPAAALLLVLAAPVAAARRKPPPPPPAAPPAPPPPSVRQGVELWRAGNDSAAVAMWQPFAAAGDADAMFNLGQAYKLGRALPRDPVLARDWFRKAATKGHLPAQANLGILLFQAGEKSEAVLWLKAAADRGERRAQYVLGIAHWNGDGVARSQALAWAYLSRAAAQGLPQSQQSLDALANSIAAADRANGEEIAASLAAGRGLPPAFVPGAPREALASAAPGDGAARPTSLGATIWSLVRQGGARLAPPAVSAPPAAGPPPATAPAPIPPTIQLAETRAAPPAPVRPTEAAVADRPGAGSALAETTITPPATRSVPVAAASVTASAAPPPRAAVAAPGSTPTAIAPSGTVIAAVRPPAGIAPPLPTVATGTAPAPVTAAAAPPPQWRVQLGAYSKRALAEAVWSEMKTQQKTVIGGRAPIFASDGSIVKLQLGPFPNQRSARDVCARIAFSGRACFVTQG